MKPPSRRLTRREKILVAVCLTLMTLSAFVIRRHHGCRVRARTIDEEVYYHLGSNLALGGPYNSRAYAERLHRRQPELGRLPSYMSAPLFKHPPLFAILQAGLFKILGMSRCTAVTISAFFGALTIPLVFFLGFLYFDAAVGAGAAFFLWMDPINVICSEKIWLDMPLGFFMTAAILAFGVGERLLPKNGHPDLRARGKARNWFLLSGAAAGAALLTKYTGGLALGVLVVFILACRPDLLRRDVLLALFGPALLLLLPWVMWNLTVYGARVSETLSTQHGLRLLSQRGILLVVTALGLAGLAAYRIRQGSRPVEEDDQEDASPEEPPTASRIRRVLFGLCGLAAVVYFFPQITGSLVPQRLPLTTWQQGLFQDPLFYPGRLVEFSFLYALAFASFFFYDERRMEQAALIDISALGLLLFFLIWQNNQSRYILPATPFLILLGVRFYQELWQEVSAWRAGPPRALGRLVLGTVVVLIVMKTIFLDVLVSYPADMCYF